MRKLTLTALTVGALAVPMSDAAAIDWATLSPVWGSSSQCGGTQNMICAAWSLKISGSTYRLDLSNTSTNTESVFKSIGLGDGNTGTTWTVDEASFKTSFGEEGSEAWSIGNLSGEDDPWNGYGMLSIIFRASADQPNQDGLKDGESMWFEWSMTSDPAGGTVTELGIHDLKGQVVNGQWESDKAVFNGPPTVVPEPSTWALLGTGLVGIFGLGRRRLRKGANG